MKPMYQRKRGLLRIAAIGQVIIMVGAGCKSPPNEGINDMSVSQALVGKDGPLTVATPGTVVNHYAALAADAAAGATSVQVSALTNLDDGRPLAAGDLLLIIQMAGATISVPTDAEDPGYGTVTNLNGAGRYEFVGVTGVSGTNTISLGCALKNAYAVAGKTQVVRVPQYTNLTVDAGGSITATAWNGIVGGVVAVHAMNTITVTGGIDANGKGFRGGVAQNGSGTTTTDVEVYWSASGDDGAMKGEGIAGDPNDAGFTNKFGRGAPANAGGGGNLHNSGGGGGANASAAGTWNGQGVMLTAADGVVGSGAWTLDPAYAISSARTSSPGGGRGGYTYSNADQNALTVAPGATGWAGNDRRERGGLGGRPLASSTSGADARLFMGGGGGAGNGNDSQPISGGNGGGLVFLIAGTVTGAGTVSANGTAGGDSGSLNPTSNSDGGGGGGGGGTIVVHAGLLNQIHITANGGRGGSQTFSGTTGTEAEGPGGGGGGGFVALSGGDPASVSANGALGGTTNSPSLTEFPSNGATAGHAGITDASAALVLYCAEPERQASAGAIIDAKPANPTKETSAHFTFKGIAADAGASIAYACSLDGNPFIACPTPHDIGGLAEGTHTLTVRIVDTSGGDAGIYGSEETWTWRVDLTPPLPVISTGPTSASGGTTSSTSATFALTATQTVAGEVVTYKCRLDGVGNFENCTGTGTAHPTYADLTDGTHTLDVRAEDDAGNASPTTPTDRTARWTWTVHALGDGGADDDGGTNDDGGVVDASSQDAPYLSDANGSDAQADSAGTVVLDAGSDLRHDVMNGGADVSVRDSAVRDTSVSQQDTASAGDADDDEAGEDGDARRDATDVRADGVNPSTDGRSLDSSLPRDTAATSPDAAVASADASVTPPGKMDASADPNMNGYKFMGGGFCSMNPSGSGTPGLATLFLVAAFGMLVVRRRRR